MALKLDTAQNEGLPGLIDPRTGETRWLGLKMEPSLQWAAGAPLYGEPEIPESQWTECDDSHLLGPILDQDGTNGCGGWSLTGLYGSQLKFMSGLEVAFHGGWIYSHTNGGSDQGSNCGDNITVGARVGFLPASALNNPVAIYPRQFPNGSDQLAANYKIKAYHRLTNSRQIVSALLNGKLVYFGTYIGTDFEPDDEGFLPDWRGRTGGHAMYLYRKLVRRSGKWYVGMANSWSRRFGVNGTANMPLSYFDGPRDGMFVAFAIDIVWLPLNTPEGQLPPPLRV